MGSTLDIDLEARSVKIENFRCIKNARIEFDRNITILIGKNGAGKTSILDAIALGLQAFQSAWEFSNKTRSIPKASRIDTGEIYGDTPYCSVELTLQSPNSNILHNGEIRVINHTERSISNDAYQSMLAEINELDSKFHKPLFIYYGQGRAFENGRSSRQAALSEDSLDGDLRAISNLEEWWDQRDAEEARTVRDSGHHDFRDPQLEAIRKLLQRIEGFQDIFYSASRKPQGLHFKKQSGAVVHVSKLSSGERSYIILLADLARRLQLSSPNRDLSEIPGIVLIDEIELNLHPAWQSQIVPTIRDVFSACQFIITTHSPQVISAIKSANVRIVRRSAEGEVKLEVPLSTRGRSSNYLLEGVFDASERLPKVDRLIYDFNEYIDDGKADSAEKTLKEIENIIEGIPADLLVLRKRLKEMRAKR